MKLSEKSEVGMGDEVSGSEVPVTAQERFVRNAYMGVDEATAGGMDRLRREEGITASCTVGCCHCCHYHILTNAAEIHALGQYVKRELSLEQREALRVRTRQWHAWDNSRPGRHPSTHAGEPTDLVDYEHRCPLLVDDTCIAYPARPLACRTHYVSSDPLSCRAANDPQSNGDAPAVLKSVVTATSPFSAAMKDHIEAAGSDFSESLVLLPHGLAIEMGWDFALTL